MSTRTSAKWATFACLCAAPLMAQEMAASAMMHAGFGSLPPEEWGVPGAYHHALARMAGTWDVKVTFQTGSVPAARELHAEAVIQQTMGELYLEENLSGGPREHPYRAHGVTGFNRVSGRVESVWFDNASTALQSYSGEMTLPGDKFVMRGKTTDPTTKQTVDTRCDVKILSEDEFVVTDYQVVGGQNRKVMERLYTRK